MIKLLILCGTLFFPAVIFADAETDAAKNFVATWERDDDKFYEGVAGHYYDPTYDSYPPTIVEDSSHSDTDHTPAVHRTIAENHTSSDHHNYPQASETSYQQWDSEEGSGYTYDMEGTSNDKSVSQTTPTDHTDLMDINPSFDAPPIEEFPLGVPKPEKKPPSPPESLERITRVHAQMLRKNHRLFWTRSDGLEYAPTDTIFLSYEHYHPRTIREARRLLMLVVHTYLDAINAGEVPNPGLSHHPFTPYDLEVEIHFDSFYGEFIDRQFVEWVKLKNGMICYQAFNCLHSKFCFVRKERFDQAEHFAELDIAEEEIYLKNKPEEMFRVLELGGPNTSAP